MNAHTNGAVLLVLAGTLAIARPFADTRRIGGRTKPK